MSETRPATHSGSWYSSNVSSLSALFSDIITEPEDNTSPKARIILAPHAGYQYCGRILGKAYSRLAIDANTTNIFVLGPSHHLYFQNRACVSKFRRCETPFGDLHVNTDITRELINRGIDNPFIYLEKEADKDEHCLEMQFSTIKYLLNKADNTHAKIIPILISHNVRNIDFAIGETLREYMDNDSHSLFIISSDFCHWGFRFDYTAYVHSNEELEKAYRECNKITQLQSAIQRKLTIPIYKSIEIIDKGAMRVLEDESGIEAYDAFKKYLEVTGDTICGERPLSVILCALGDKKTSFKWCAYSQSNQCTRLTESSVSYAAGYCVL
ncbi:related to MEMO1 family protein YJR008W [Saccharomycodes ludwigii]|uniref:Related to MEMO1 family protein YJR008W n=1 Tax=Saccharomycodes ludwigii TaxID=36035 RepID=A0A376BAU5_9ASCO|nr:hypothetical protein SCDLUD_004836 [Saccharomycodes ludwigii]KAH3899393.1 hypothetical protein SCDLUD_004836 [Saccharomycodes ludwigii]SSD61803.1 related to MEMO1 family protein YJR008W [Saccharomycodes ludwigii]